MAAQAGLCLAWSETPEDTFCRAVAHVILAGKIKNKNIANILRIIIRTKAKNKFCITLSLQTLNVFPATYNFKRPIIFPGNERL